MKGSEAFEITIETYLKEKAKSNLLFLRTFRKPNKNIKDCITYILNTVKTSGSAGFDDVEIFNMATHYYDEDDIKVGSAISGNVVVNHHVKLTEEEIAEAKQKALDAVFTEEKARLRKKPVKRSTSTPISAPAPPEDGKPAEGQLF